MKKIPSLDPRCFAARIVTAATTAMFIGLLLIGVSARAQQLANWIATSDNFTDPAAWDAGFVPGMTNNAAIGNGGTCLYAATMTNTISHFWLGVTNGVTGNTLLISGGSLVISNTGGFEFDLGGMPPVGTTFNFNSDGIFTMSGGNFQALDAIGSANPAGLDNWVGMGTNSTGVINFNGGTAELWDMMLGEYGNGTVNINGGTVTVDSWLGIGRGNANTQTSGQGTLNLNSGTLNALFNNGIVGYGGFIIKQQATNGIFNMSGGTLNCSRLAVNYDTVPPGAAIFNVSGGNLNLAQGGIIIGSPASSTVAVEENVSGGTFSTYPGTSGWSWTGSGATIVNLTNAPGPGTATFAPAAGTAITLSIPFSGPGSVAMTGPGTLVIATNDSYTGDTTVSGGMLASGPNATIAGNVIMGSGTTISAGNGGPGLFTVNQLSMSNTTNVITLGSNPSDMSGAVNSFVQVNGNLTLSGVNTLQLNPSGILDTNTPYTIFQYGGALSGGLANFTIFNSNPRYTYTLLDPAVTAPYIEIQVGGALQPLVWKGGASSAPNVWDVGTLNWFNTVSDHADQFYNADAVIFDDTATTNMINVTQFVAPVNMAFSNTVNYTFYGAGKISGALDQEGTGTVTLGVSNAPTLSSIINNSGTLVFAPQVIGSYTVSAPISDNGNGLGTIVQGGSNTMYLTANNLNWSGTLVVTNGVLQYNNSAALGQASSTAYVTNNGTLDIHGVGMGLKGLVIDGAGFNGQGAINCSAGSGGQSSGPFNITLLGDTTLGCGGTRWDIGNNTLHAGGGSFAGNGYTLTKTGAGQLWIHEVGDMGVGDINLNQGLLGFNYTIGLGNPTKTLTIATKATLELYSIYNNVVNKNVVLNGVVTNGGAYITSTGGAGASNVINGTITLYGTTSTDLGSVSYPTNNDINAGQPTTLPGPIVGPGGFAKDGASALYLTGVNSYTGPTYINAGSIVLGPNATLSSSEIWIASGGTLNVANPASFNLGNGQELVGNGKVIGGNIAFGSGSTLAPGVPGVTTYTLTMNGNLTLQSGSSYSVKVNKTASVANDKVSGLNSVTIGGTLVITNIGSALASGDAIPLFSATNSYSGSFSGIVPSTPGAGLEWDTSTLDTDGTLRVVVSGFSLAPTNIVAQMTSNQLTLSWPYDHTGWRLQTQTNGLNVGLSTNWVTVPNSGATNLVIIPINPTNGCVFYRIFYP